MNKKPTLRATALSQEQRQQELRKIADEARQKPRTLAEAYSFLARAQKLRGKPLLEPLTYEQTASKGVAAEGTRSEQEARLPRIVITEAVAPQTHAGITPEGIGIRKQPQAEGVVVAEGEARETKAGDAN